MPECFLGIDIGTSVTKAVLFDEAFRMVAAAHRRTRIDRPSEGWSETDPEVVWRNVTETCREIATARDSRDIAAIGICGTMVGAWVVDAQGAALRPGITWEDSRTEPMIEAKLAADPSFLSRIFASSGSVMQQGCTLPLLRWLIDNEPGVMARAAAVFSSKDFVRMRLTGRVAADRTEAAVAPGSAKDRDRSSAMLDMFGLGAWRHLLPQALESETIAGTVTRAAAEATGLAEGTPVAVGAGDVPASVIGAGGSDPGTVVSILGTTALNGVLVGEPVFTPPDLGLLFTVPGDMWLRVMVNVAGTISLDWLVETMCPDLAGRPDLHARLEEMADSAGIGADGVTYLPFLSDSGIIAPRVERHARAGFAGLSPRHGRAHLVRAVYEGTILAIRDCFEAMARPFDRIRLIGGGARSAFWSQMLADVMQRPVDIPAGGEFGAKGAALLAATAAGRFPSIREASRRTFSLSRSHQPDRVAGEAYQAVYQRYGVRRDAFLDTIARGSA
jgi:sugar (pentulose or hexulose) kinase